MPIKKSSIRSILSISLDDDTLAFLNAVSMGNLAHTKSALSGVDDARAKKLLQSTDNKDRTALEIATENEHYDIVVYFIDEHSGHLNIQQVNESLMLAITKGYLNITQILLEHSGFTEASSRLRHTLGRHETFYDRNYRSKFDRDVTPIMMAAMCNEVDIIRLLLDRGATIVKPHRPICGCTNCENRKQFDPLMHSLFIINAYRALTSAAYISLTSPDPILTAFLLSEELYELSLTEKEFKNEYKELQKKCKEYASDLLDMCQNTDEVKTILKQKAMTEDEMNSLNLPVMKAKVNDKEDEYDLPRLQLAIKYRQKQFVAHPHCQHHLSTLWYQGLPGIRQLTPWQQGIVLFLFAPALPFAVLIYLVYPKGKFGAFMRSPIIKFINQAGMYIFFLVLMFLQSVTADTFKQDEKATKIFLKSLSNFCEPLADALDVQGGKTSPMRIDRLSFIEIMLIVFVFGMVWQEIKQLWREGFKTYVSSLWNWIDVAMQNLLIAAIMLEFTMTRETLQAKSYFSTSESCSLLKKGDPNALYQAYVITGDRRLWNDDDPTLIAEALFAVANVLSFSRLAFILPVSEFLGPLQISLGRMMGDITRFAAVFGVVFLAFFCSMCNLYWYYPDDSNFGTLLNSFKTLMWALFGLGDTADTECPSEQPNCGHGTTEVFGVIIYAAYHAVIVVVMLNMLIAMMSTSFDEINNDEDVEWKFSRSKLWINYFEKGATLPMPFNLIPSAKSIFYACKWVKNMLVKTDSSKRMKTRGDLTDGNQIALRNAVRRSQASHVDLMKIVVKRYLFKLQRSKDTDEVDEGELDEIKNDISSFRFEVLDILGNLNSRMESTIPPNACGATHDWNSRSAGEEDERASKGTLSSGSDIERAIAVIHEKLDILNHAIQGFQTALSNISEQNI